MSVLPVVPATRVGVAAARASAPHIHVPGDLAPPPARLTIEHGMDHAELSAEALAAHAARTRVWLGQASRAAGEVSSRMRALAAEAAEFATRLRPVSAWLDAQPRGPAHDVAGSAAPSCAMFDDYFGLFRRRGMSWLQLASQVSGTLAAALTDLAEVPLRLMDLDALLGGTCAMLDSVSDGLRQRTVHAVPPRDPVALVPDGPLHPGRALVQRALADPELREPVLRWQIGHHMYIQCICMARFALDEAAIQVRAGRAAQAAARIERARVLLMAGTAAMWHAAAMPQKVYVQHVRPTMNSPLLPNGFSGMHNADHVALKRARAGLSNALAEGFGQTVPCPDLLAAAAMEYHAAEVRDYENHVLIAAHFLGAESSLRTAGGAAIARGAADILRDMAGATRRRPLLPVANTQRAIDLRSTHEVD
jgi:hypothetical protein